MPKYCTGLPEFLIILTGTANKVGSPTVKDTSQLRLPTTQMTMWHQNYKLYYMGRRETGSLLNIQRIHVYLIHVSNLHPTWPESTQKKKYYFFAEQSDTSVIVSAHNWLYSHSSTWKMEYFTRTFCSTQTAKITSHRQMLSMTAKPGTTTYHIYNYITSQRRDVIHELWYIAAHKATRHLPTQGAVYGTWSVCRGQKAEVMNGMRWA